MLNRLRNFIEAEAAGGVVMVGFAALALFAANSSFAPVYGQAAHAAHFLVNDVLMTLFFFAVGMELKAEMKEGVLAERSQIILPLVAAIGGMAVPALVYFLLTPPEYASGWAIPSATDIAFALCVLTLLGRRVPPALKTFLLAVAIFDDLGAILVIALFYGGALSFLPLLLAALAAAALWALNRRGVNALWPYLAVGVFLWFCLHQGGIHTTLAGVLVGMALPMATLHRCLHALHPFVTFGVLPLFALVNAGVSLHGANAAVLLSPLPLGVAAGLFFGKQAGIFLSSAALIRLRLATLPEGVSWLQLYGVSAIAGIGFTMSLFIGLLAFHAPETQELMKLGVLSGSLLSALWGALVLKAAMRRAP